MVKKESTRGLADPRFAHLTSDPKFNALKRKERKVVLESRFAAALTDSRFGKQAAVDSRGRRLRKTTSSLHALYDLEDKEGQKEKKSDKKVKATTKISVVEKKKTDDEEKSDEENEEEEESGEESEESGGEQESEKEEEEENSADEDEPIKVDLARGEGNLSSSSEDDDSGSEWELEEQEEEHGWGELDREARRVEWASRRLAICNLDWDHLSCDDLFMLVSSFKPLGGECSRLAIYLSDVGKEKLAKEELHGPELKMAMEIGGEGGEKADSEEEEENDEDEENANEKSRSEAIRRYQLERLKFYYGVLECDSAQTASAIYEACDGVEYEQSGLKLDMRFVPDDMEFDESRIKEQATSEDVQKEKYRPSEVASSALGSSKVKLSWDETDPKRSRKLKEAFDENADLDAMAQELIGASSGEEDAEEEDDEERQRKLRLLLGGTGDDDGKELEIEWESEEKEEKQRKRGEDKEEKKSTFEQFLEKRKAKRKERKAKIAELKRAAREERDGGGEREKQTEEKARESKKKREREEDGGKKEKKKEVAEEIAADPRFGALFTDSAFAIEQASGLAKDTKLLEKQKERRLKRKAPTTAAARDGGGEAGGETDLIAKLKKKSQKWK